MSTVHADSLITLHYRLAAPDGTAWIDTFGHNPATLTLGAQQLAPVLEACLIGLEEGAQQRFVLAAADGNGAFGAHDPARVQRVPRAVLQAQLDDAVELKVGDAIRLAGLTSASGATAGAIVSALDEAEIELDFNHPLAGKPVVFDVQILGVL